MSDSDNSSSGQAAFPQQAAAFPNVSAPPRYQAIARGAAVINQGAQAVGRGVAAGLRAIDYAGKQIGGSTPAY